MFECEQCRVWGYVLQPMTQEEAELHLLYVHPTRFHRLFRIYAGQTAAEKEVLRMDIRDSLRARKE